MKVVALCSGGFDSVCLVNWLNYEYLHEGDELHILFFDYGQKSEKEEEKCARKVSDKVKADSFHKVQIPPISWTKGNFYGEGYEENSQYLEYRNFIFLSYAFSLAESIGAEKIFLALLKNSHANYKDCKKSFIKQLNGIDKGIEVVAPFHESIKDNLSDIAFHYDILEGDFHSCDVCKDDGTPCGSCPDCEDTKYVMSIVHSQLDSSIGAFRKNNFSCDSEAFKKNAMNCKLSELRILGNDSCQLSCPHCYHGDTKRLSKLLTKEEWLSVISQAFDLGISSVHFAGKEPLYHTGDEFSIFDYLEMVEEVEKEKGRKVEKSIVSNGINFTKEVAEKLSKYKLQKISFSVDDAVPKSSALRGSRGFVKNLRIADSYGIPVEVFVDLHKNNFDKVQAIIHSIESVDPAFHRHIYFRALSYVGNAGDLEPLSLEEIQRVHFDLRTLDRLLNKETTCSLSLGVDYVYQLLASEKISEEEFSISKDIFNVYYSGCMNINGYYSLFPEFYCERYSSQITISCDGYALGCALDISHADYDKYGAGNIRNKSLSELLKVGREETVSIDMKRFSENSTCRFCTARVGKTI